MSFAIIYLLAGAVMAYRIIRYHWIRSPERSKVLMIAVSPLIAALWPLIGFMAVDEMFSV